MATHNLHNHILRVSGKGRINTGATQLRTAIAANALLFLSLGALFVAPAIGCPLTALLVYASKRNRKLGRLWVRYYKIITTIENRL